MARDIPTTIDLINKNDELAKTKLDSLKQYFVDVLHDFFNTDMMLHNMNLEDLNRKYNALYLKRGENTKL